MDCLPPPLQALLLVSDPTIKKAMVRWSIAFPKTVKAHLREDGDVQQELLVRLSYFAV